MTISASRYFTSLALLSFFPLEPWPQPSCASSCSRPRAIWSLRISTLHGVIMVWFFLIPSIPAVLGNFVIPLMIGARDVAFPRLNLASWYIFMIGGAIVLYSILRGGADTGWTFYTPYSSTYSNSAVMSM